MKQHAMPELPADNSLPSPVVLRPEDLASVAAAGASRAVMAPVLSKIIIAGGIPAGPYLAATAF
jgi:hypothetical protein